MARFFFNGRPLDLPAVPVNPRSPSRDATAWEFGNYVTVRLLTPARGLRVHTAGKEFPGREASSSQGAWVALGDVIQTSSQLASSRSLPTDDPTSMTAFTHINEVTLPSNVVLNIGIAATKFGGHGGGFQAEYVSGPPLEFTSLEGKHWHGRAGSA